MASGSYFNSTNLMGQIVTEPTKHVVTRKGKTKELTIVNFVLWVKSRTWFGGESTARIPVKMFGSVALHALRLELRRGDFVFVTGRIDTNRRQHGDGEWKSHFCVIAENFRALWPPPQVFKGGFCQIPVAEYNRLKMLVDQAGLDDFDLPPGVLEELGLQPQGKPETLVAKPGKPKPVPGRRKRKQ